MFWSIEDIAQFIGKMGTLSRLSGVGGYLKFQRGVNVCGIEQRVTTVTVLDYWVTSQETKTRKGRSERGQTQYLLGILYFALFPHSLYLFIHVDCS